MLEVAFDHLGLNYRDHVEVDERFIRPADVDQLVGDATKARDSLGWVPEVAFEELIKMMVDHDLALLGKLA